MNQCRRLLHFAFEMSLSNKDNDNDDAFEDFMKNGTPFQKRRLWLWRSYKRTKRLNDESKPERKKRDRPDCGTSGRQGVNYSMMPSGVTNSYVGPPPIEHKWLVFLALTKLRWRRSVRREYA